MHALTLIRADQAVEEPDLHFFDNCTVNLLICEVLQIWLNLIMSLAIFPHPTPYFRQMATE